MKYKINNFKKYEKGFLKGFCDLEAWPLTIRGLTVFEKNGSFWMGLPGKPEIKDGMPVLEDGKIKHYPVITCAPDQKENFQNWLKAEAQKLLERPEAEKPEDTDSPF